MLIPSINNSLKKLIDLLAQMSNAQSILNGILVK
jgi:hypothetical protein